MKINARSLIKFMKASIITIFASLFLLYVIDPYLLYYLMFSVFVSAIILGVLSSLVLLLEEHFENYEPKPWNIKKTIFFVLISLILIFQIYKLITNLINVGNVNRVLRFLGSEPRGVAFMVFLIISPVLILFIIKELIRHLVNNYLDKKYPELKDEPLMASSAKNRLVKVISFVKGIIIFFLIIINFVYIMPGFQSLTISTLLFFSLALLTAVQTLFTK